LTEDELIKGCIQDEAACQKRSSTVTQAACLAYASVMPVTSSDAEDILQDAFIKVFNKIGQFKSEGSFEGWIRRIVVNTAIKKYSLIRYQKELSGYEITEHAHQAEDASAYSISPKKTCWL
jgi:RNA polymerase sigma factor (sigma-70 family)